MTAILKKVSVATVINKPKGYLKTLTQETMLCRIVGIVRGFEQGETQFGPFFAFKGDFTATNAETGEVSIGAKAFLPAPLDSLLVEQIRALQEAQKGVNVEFAFDISAAPDPKTEVGYQYRVKTVFDTKPSDPLAALLERTAALAPLALTAPAATETPAAADTPAETAAAPADAAAETPAAETGKGKRK